MITKTDLSKSRMSWAMVSVCLLCEATYISSNLSSFWGIKTCWTPPQSFFLLRDLHWLFLKMHIYPVHETKNTSMTNDVSCNARPDTQISSTFCPKHTQKLGMTQSRWRSGLLHLEKSCRPKSYTTNIMSDRRTIKRLLLPLRPPSAHTT